VWLQQLGAAQREAALRGERTRLDRWGQPRTHVPARPTTSLDDEAEAALLVLRAGVPTSGEALPPLLAAALLGQPSTRAEMGGAAECALRQWALRSRAPGSASDRSAALNDWRYALLIDLGAFHPGPKAPPAVGGGYPRLAAQYGLEGAVTVEVAFDAEGRATRSRIVERKLLLPGLEGTRPVAFETVFDEASHEAARRRARPVPGKSAVQVELKWQLEP
jgi:hypothetical protein